MIGLPSAPNFNRNQSSSGVLSIADGSSDQESLISRHIINALPALIQEEEDKEEGDRDSFQEDDPHEDGSSSQNEGEAED